ncbi:dehydrogenase [Gordonibacter sp. 28C]|uniref:molybdopterin-dependent oxidoreductase n=1 Tax=Gordonibacter sp. 28C TaxID=2078569 RepID=UPI000DF7A2F1|nr:molybdopterin-dependent oxidoreductase [Gordonibacter sp. 28C]RDB59295.1 dehydrogenase [Gordonibacter sp. 28C]
MLFNYDEFLESIDREAYHEGEWRWEEDGYEVTRTYPYSAPGCHNSCGLLYYTKDGKLERVEGDPLDPFAGGKLCMRCLDLPEVVNHPERIKYPMKRVGERGENKWERITWDEAGEIIKAELAKLDAQGYGRESIFVGSGTGRNVIWQVPLIGVALGTPNVGPLNLTGQSCYAPRVCGTAAPMGDYPIVDASMTSPDRYANVEWRKTDILVVWGNEPLKSNADGYIGHWLLPAIQMGTKIISVDPVLTWWGARAEYWLPVRPGTDCAMALAWLNVIISEDLYDHEFVDCWCAYFEELAEHVKQFTPEWAAEICGVPEEDIVGAARLYANASPGAIQWGLAYDTQVASMELTLAASDIMAICGDIDVPGGAVLVHNSFEINAGYALTDMYLPNADKKLTIRDLGYEGFPFMGSPDPDAVNIAMEAGKPYPIKMLWTQSSNALSCMSFAAPRTYETVKNAIDFCVYADPFMTPSMVAFADLVLPVAMTTERNSARTWWEPVRAMKKVTSFYEAKSDEEIICWLGNLLSPEIFKRWPTAEDLIEDYLRTGLAARGEDGEIVKAVFVAALDDDDAGLNERKDSEDERTLFRASEEGIALFDDLVQNSCGHRYWDWNGTYRKYEKGLLRPDGKVGFNTISGRIELVPPTYRVWGIDPLPTHSENIQSQKWFNDPEFRKEYPFYCVNGARSYEFFHSEHRQLETMREFHPDPLVKINPETAKEYGLKDGDWIWIENPDGRFKQRVKIFPGVSKWCVSAEHGWWFPEQPAEEPYLFGTFDSNPNNITHVMETGSGGVGAPRKNVCCKIYKVQEGDTMPGEQITRLGGFRDYVAGEM